MEARSETAAASSSAVKSGALRTTSSSCGTSVVYSYGP
jgi:hypothetical protein